MTSPKPFYEVKSKMDSFSDPEINWHSRASRESDRDSNEIRFRDVSNTIISSAPKERFRLGYFSVMCLVINRMIGTGIFNTPSTSMRGTQSIGISLLFWVVGMIYTFAGVHVFVEYGLNTPRYDFEGAEVGVPRSGGALNYLIYAFPRPAFRSNTAYLSGTIFSITYILLGSMSGNCIAFAIRSLQAANIPRDEQSKGAVYGIAIGVATFACFIHAFSRRGGIWLGNFMAVIKVMILLVVIGAGFASIGNAFKTDPSPENLEPKNAFADAPDDAYGYAQAFLAVLFAYNGYEQPCYVLGEIKRPHKTYPRATALAAGLVSILYILCNVAYSLVIPKVEMIAPDSDVAVTFFNRTFGSLTSNEDTPQRILAAFMAFSSLGNIITMTYIAARVKQEIAKEGIIPFAKILGQSRDVSVGRLLKWMRGNPTLGRRFRRILNLSFMAPENHTQETPVAALALHLFFCICVIALTVGLKPADAYNVLVSIFSYCNDGIFGFMLGLGILCLRFNPQRGWKTKAKGVLPGLSVISAVVFALCSAFPVVALWVAPTGEYARTTIDNISWFVTPAAGWIAIGFGLLWWLVFCLVVRQIETKQKKVFTVERVPDLSRETPNGPPIQIHETVFLNWTAKETLNTDFAITEIASSYKN